MWQIVHCCKGQAFARRNQSIFNTNIFSSAIHVNLVSVCVYILYYLFCSFIIQTKVWIQASQLEQITIENMKEQNRSRYRSLTKIVLKLSLKFEMIKVKMKHLLMKSDVDGKWIFCSYIPSENGCVRNTLNCDRLRRPSCHVALLEILVT